MVALVAPGNRAVEIGMVTQFFGTYNFNGLVQKVSLKSIQVKKLHDVYNLFMAV